MGFEDQLKHDTLTSLLGLAWVLMCTDVFRCAPSKDCFKKTVLIVISSDQVNVRSILS